MKKIIVLFTVATLIVASVCLAEAQQPKKVPLIAVSIAGRSSY